MKTKQSKHKSKKCIAPVKPIIKSVQGIDSINIKVIASPKEVIEFLTTTSNSHKDKYILAYYHRIYSMNITIDNYCILRDKDKVRFNIISSLTNLVVYPRINITKSSTTFEFKGLHDYQTLAYKEVFFLVKLLLGKFGKNVYLKRLDVFADYKFSKEDSFFFTSDSNKLNPSIDNDDKELLTNYFTKEDSDRYQTYAYNKSYKESIPLLNNKDYLFRLEYSLQKRLGDYSTNLAELCQTKNDKPIEFCLKQKMYINFNGSTQLINLDNIRHNLIILYRYLSGELTDLSKMKLGKIEDFARILTIRNAAYMFFEQYIKSNDAINEKSSTFLLYKKFKQKHKHLAINKDRFYIFWECFNSSRELDYDKYWAGLRNAKFNHFNTESPNKNTTNRILQIIKQSQTELKKATSQTKYNDIYEVKSQPYYLSNPKDKSIRHKKFIKLSKNPLSDASDEIRQNGELYRLMSNIYYSNLQPNSQAKTYSNNIKALNDKYPVELSTKIAIIVHKKKTNRVIDSKATPALNTPQAIIDARVDMALESDD